MSLVSFLINTGRTLSQMALYSPDHPMVKGTIEESHRVLSDLLRENPEISLGLGEGKLLVNGQVPQDVPPTSLRPFEQLLNTYGLYSLTFLPGIELHELMAFFDLAYRKDLKKEGTDVPAYLKGKTVTHIVCNQSRYEKVSEDEEVGNAGLSNIKSDEGAHWEKLKDLSLAHLTEQLLEKSFGDAQYRKLVRDRMRTLVAEEIEKDVQRRTQELVQEKVQATNERDRVEGVMETVADGVVVVDEKANVLMMNPAAEALYGVKLGERIGKPLWEGVKEEQMIALARDMANPTDRPLVKEVELRAREDTSKTLRASAASIQDPNGRVVGMISVLSDVTKQKELTRLQNEFMANVTHDLRAPIHTIKLAVSAILEEAAGPVSKEQIRMLTLAGQNADRLARLIDDLLDFSQVESGKMQIRRVVMDLAPLLKDTMASFESWSRSRGIGLTLSVEAGLNPIYADPDRLLQVVINLISNAIKFTPSGGKVTVRAKNLLEEGRKKVRIEVEDTGKGIPKEDQKRIFDRFIQLANQGQHEVRGTGLGLSICRALVQAHESTLAVQSPPPGTKSGTIFWFALQAVEKSNATPAKKEEQPAADKIKEKRGFLKKFFSKFKMTVMILAVLAAGAQARPYWGQVRRVMEGNIIQLQDGTLVQYLGINTPPKGNPAHAEAVSANMGLVLNQEVYLEYGLQERDAQGMWQAYVFSDGLMVNRELVRQGWAIVARLDADEEYLTSLVRAEKEAARLKKGLWADTAIEPYAVRIKKKGADDFPWASGQEIKRGVKGEGGEETEK